jgi:vacuolar-type H+-ATPase subunit H
MSDTNKPAPDKARDDLNTARDRAGREAGAAREEAQKLGEKVSQQAGDFAEKAKERAYDEAETGKETVAGGLDDFAAAVRRASDELGDRDQSMASRLVREVAGGLEDASRSIHGRSIEEMTRSVASFARRRPSTFLAGAALAGIALGRFARASGEHSYNEYGSDARSTGSAGGAPRASGYAPTYSDQPRPVEGAHPVGVDPVTGKQRHQDPAVATSTASKPATTSVSSGIDPVTGKPRSAVSPGTTASTTGTTPKTPGGSNVR